MHDITGYMLCSLELNMQALFMYTVMWFYFCTCACVRVCVCARARAVLVLIVLAHCVHTGMDACLQCM